MADWSTEKLVKALEDAGAPDSLVAMARQDAFHDFRSPSATPIIDLVFACQREGLHDVANRAKQGEFDASKEESEEWMNSEDGKETARKLFE